MELVEFRSKLKKEAIASGVDSSEVDYILAFCLNTSVTKISLIDEIDKTNEKRAQSILKQRLKGKPIDKITGQKFFYSRPFIVDKNVLSPRPETELLVESALEYIDNNNITNVLDLCTGSGCIGITISLESGLVPICSDVSRSALKICKKNAKSLKASIKTIRSNLFDNIKDKFDLILTNPPYIPSNEIEKLDIEVKKFDPRLALDGGADGLNFYKAISSKLSDYLVVGGLIFMEIGENQADDIKKIFINFEYVKSIFDYNGIERVLIFRRKI